MLNQKSPKTTQYRNLMLIAVILLAGLATLYEFLHSHSETQQQQLSTKTINFSSPIETVDSKKLWLERASNQLKDQQRELSELKQQWSEFQKNQPNTTVTHDPHYQQLQQQVETLQQTVDNKLSQPSPAPFPISPSANPNTMSNPLTVGIDDDELNLKPILNKRPQKNPDSFVPAGTFVQAVMLGAADASAGVMSQANPSPMLFRITAEGTLPNHHRSHLKDCVATAAVIGDISSERGEIRLERLSCTFANGEIVEQSVEGTVFGMDAKNGVRGHPLWREGALLERAAIAGTLSGFASGISQKYITNSISPLGATQTVTGQDIFKYGAAQGASSAMERLADYHIQQAEHYHPVIQLSAGQAVDLVFLKGFYLDGKKRDESTADNNVQPELFSSPQHHTANGLMLSEQQLQQIQQHETAMGLHRASGERS